jgi:ribulose-5-phosphate 4-epimerase/fuculose-1-phosphate aldolase
MTSVRSVVNPEAAVLAAAKDMLRRGLVEGTAGNISARREDGNLVITPSSVDYSDMTLDDLVVVTIDGDEVAPGLLSGIRRHRQRHPQSSGVGHHVRHRAPADSSVH